MRLLCVYANRKMAVVLTNFSAMFPFVTCVKESENQANGFGESHRKSQPRGGGALPYMGYIGTCRGIGYGFWRFSILK